MVILTVSYGLKSMDVIGMHIHVIMQLMEVILIVLSGLESMDVTGTHLHAIGQLEEGI